MAGETSAVLEYGVPAPGETVAMMEDKLRLHTDSWDLSVESQSRSFRHRRDRRPLLRCIRRWPHPWCRQLPAPGDECRNHCTARPQQGLCRLLRCDWLQCVNQGRVQAGWARISRQGTARRDRLVASRRAPGDRFARAGQFACSRIAASRRASSRGARPKKITNLASDAGCYETGLLISAQQAKRASSENN
jgi:hypothetical protein